MQILPVLDLLDRVVVRGVAGRRSEYLPIVSKLTQSSDPVAVALAIRDAFGLESLYVADLDGILHQQPNLTIYHNLIAEGFQLLVDSGVGKPADTVAVQATGVTHFVIGLETCQSPEHLASIVECVPEVTFSLDLQHGTPHLSANAVGWCIHPEQIVRQIAETSVRSIIVLDLLDVGMATGGSTDALCQFAKDEFPHIQIITGGGVRGRNDLARLRRLGINAVLVASALHDGRLTRDEIRVVTSAP